MSAAQMLEIAIKLLTPLILLSAIAFYWAGKCQAPRLAPALRWHSLIWTGLVATVCGVLFMMSATCSGHIEYGYHSCPIIPDSIAVVYLDILMLAWLMAIACTVILFIISAVKEVRARRNRPSPLSSPSVKD